MDNYVACIAVARVVHHLFKGETCGGRIVHVGLSTLLPELHSQLMLANLLLEQDLFSEYQNILHVLKYSDLKVGDGHQLIIKLDT